MNGSIINRSSARFTAGHERITTGQQGIIAGPCVGAAGQGGFAVSLLVATYNRADYLERTLRSLAAQRFDAARFEIVVVDNNSGDHTRRVCEEFRAGNPELNFTYSFEPVQGLSAARNNAIAAARGEILVMLDDDIEAHPELTGAYARFFDSHPEVEACGGMVLPLYEVPSPEWRSHITDMFIASALDLGKRTRPFPRRRYPIGANFGFRHDVPEKIGGFDTKLGRNGKTPLGGEEKEFIDRLRGAGGEVWYLCEAVVLHFVPGWKITDKYFDRVTHGMGTSQRVRSLSVSRYAYLTSLAKEAMKWPAAALIAIYYLLRGRPVAGVYLLRMRRNVTKGLLY